MSLIPPRYELPVVVDKDGHISREWYKYLVLLGNSVGGSTTASDDAQILQNVDSGAIESAALTAGIDAKTALALWLLGDQDQPKLIISDGSSTISNISKLNVSGATLSGSSPSPTLTFSGGGGVPSGINDLIFWWQADLSKVSSGAILQRMPDSGPWTLNAAGPVSTTPTVTRDAAALNGKNTFTWSGTTNSRYNFETPLFVTAATYFLVAKTVVSTRAWNIAGSAGSLQYTHDSATGKQVLLKDATTTIGASTTGLTPGTWYQMNATYDGTSAYAFRLAQTADGSGTNTQSIVAPITAFGYNPGAGPGEDAQGSFAEFIAFSRVLTLTEIQTVESYLHTKWGV